jgi:hypothetical protein
VCASGGRDRFQVGQNCRGPLGLLCAVTPVMDATASVEPILQIPAPAEVFKIAQVNAPQEVPYCCSKRCSQGSVPWTVGETRRSEGTKIMAGADRRGLPAAVSVENATPHEVKLVVPVLKARRRFRLKRIEELMDRSLTEVRLRLGPKRAQVSSRRGYSSGAGQFWRGALFYSTRRTSLSQRGQPGAVEAPIDNFRPRTGQGLSYA